MTRINPRIRGLAAVVLILVVLFGTPMLLIFVGATPWSVDWSQLRMLLLSPDDGTVALILVGIVAWVAWSVMAFCLISEVIAAVRGIRTPRLPVIGTGQHLAAQLVAAAALLFTVAQPLAITFSAVPAHAQDQTPHDVRPAQAPAAQSVPSAETSRTVVAEQVERRLEVAGVQAERVVHVVAGQLLAVERQPVLEVRRPRLRRTHVEVHAASHARILSGAAQVAPSARTTADGLGRPS